MCWRWRRTYDLIKLNHSSLSLWCSFGLRFRLASRDHFASAAFRFDFGASRGAKSMRAYCRLPSQFSPAKNFDAITDAGAVRQTRLTQARSIHAGTIGKTVERFEVH